MIFIKMIHIFILPLVGNDVYDIVQNTWDIIELRDGLKDDAVWDIEISYEFFICATNRY